MVTKPLKLKKLYPTVKELKDKINAFFEEYRPDTIHKPSAEWFAVYLGIDYDTWLNYVKTNQLTFEEQYGKDSQEIIGTLSRAKTMLLANMVDISCTKEGGKGGDLNLKRYGAVKPEDVSQEVKITLGDTLDKYAK